MDVIIHESKDIATVTMTKDEYTTVAGAVESVMKIRAYAEELLIWNRNDASVPTRQIATDILYLIGEK